MKPSSYIALALLVCLPALLLDIPTFYEFFLAYFIVYIAGLIIIEKLFKNQIEYQRMCKKTIMLEMAYNNDYKQYKRQAFIGMIDYAILFATSLLIIIVLIFSSNVPFIDYIFWGTFMILISLPFSWHIRLYLKVKKTGHVMLDEELQNLYPSYTDKRNTHTYEEMLLPCPKHYKVIMTANTFFAILSIVFGILTITLSYTYREELDSYIELLNTSLIIFYSAFAIIYYGIKGLPNTSNSPKHLLLLFSCIVAVLLYMPSTSYFNKTFLAKYIGDDSSLCYNTKSNILRKTITVDEITNFEPTYINIKKRHLLTLSSEGQKKLLKNIIRVNAEYQVVYRDSSENERVITIVPSELKDIYHLNKSYLDILLEILKLDLDEKSTKIYDDGEYIIVELCKNVPYPMQSEQTSISICLANFAKEIAQDYGVASFNRGLKMRLIFNNNKFIENTLSLEEIKNTIENTNIKVSEKTFGGLIDMFSGKSTENQYE